MELKKYADLSTGSTLVQLLTAARHITQQTTKNQFSQENRIYRNKIV